MIQSTWQRLSAWGGFSFLAGIFIVACSLGLGGMSDLRGANTPYTLAYFVLASLAYGASVIRLERDRPPLTMIWIFALLIRLPLLLHPPTLSDDVYRHIWDGHLLIQRINPYAFAVNSSALDVYATPFRSLVNHSTMASPYLPVAQVISALIVGIAPHSPLAFQVCAMIFDLASGWIIAGLLRRTGLPVRRCLVYLWCPLVAVESTHGAHIDYWMILWMLLAFWILTSPSQGKEPHAGLKKTSSRRGWHVREIASSLALGSATLVKGVPVLIAPLFLRRWGWRGITAFIVWIIGLSGVFALKGGWGLTGPLDGTGLFGAIRIYMTSWNYNSSIYHWLEVGLAGYPSAGAVPPEAAYMKSIFISRAITAGLLGAAVIAAGILVFKLDIPGRGDSIQRLRSLLRLALLPLGSYIMLSAVVHPWYLVIVMPFLPFFWPTPQETWRPDYLAWPWIYLSCAVAFSYATYLDPLHLHEYAWVRNVEYLPFYGLMIWALIKSRMRLVISPSY
jgi:alpha-1,6-mannosyltransferase